MKEVALWGNSVQSVAVIDFEGLYDRVRMGKGVKISPVLVYLNRSFFMIGILKDE